MNGVTARALQSFIQTTYGDAVWAAVLADSRVEVPSFELMLNYAPQLTERVLGAAAKHLNRAPDEVLEDLGLFLVSHADMQPLRRLLRFGGVDFAAFVQSMGDLPERARMVLPHATMPPIRPVDEGDGRWAIFCGRRPEGMVHVIRGGIRAMADDYGALATVELGPDEGPNHRLDVTILSDHFSEGRVFDLAAQAE
ncbi:Haem-NO-binding [Palleronia marisminoris]|uniref:Heme NO binding protein n=1 Tax=Palleronia marisminoris TaxID=315423 RepID=A0A1Y5T6V0_9RHOB|nr:heme NO-binding domain-containing protein [Palleronia marisminoris]SFH21172.1 Haem-NO-binding [Palleronia marisminoris]SLN57247.1 Heme NO binding protein [Palleronia marisminoris]